MESLKIHGGKIVQLIPETSNIKIEEGEFYSVESFLITLTRNTHEKTFQESPDAFNYVKTKAGQPKALFKYIDEHFSNITFSQRWLEESGFTQIDKNKIFMLHNFVEP